MFRYLQLAFVASAMLLPNTAWNAAHEILAVRFRRICNAPPQYGVHMDLHMQQLQIPLHTPTSTQQSIKPQTAIDLMQHSSIPLFNTTQTSLARTASLGSHPSISLAHASEPSVSPPLHHDHHSAETSARRTRLRTRWVDPRSFGRGIADSEHKMH